MKRLSVLFYILSVAACLFVLTGAGYAGAERASVDITVDGKTYSYTDEHVVPSDFTVSEQIELRKINAPLPEKIRLVDKCISRGASYSAAIDTCFPRLSALVDKIADEVYRPCKDAQITYKNGKFDVLPEIDGRMLDKNKLFASIYFALKFGGGGAVKGCSECVKPEVTARELKSRLLLRGKYTTVFAGSSEERAHNVKLALSRIDGITIPAGKTLSFNATVGERTAANGFKSAKIIVDGKYTDGIGGGACQASTAVYNAALIAGLECNANAHSICPSYCDAGLDAMISSVSDLLITNVTSYPVYISARSHGNSATVCIYGEQPEYTTVPESVVISSVPCDVSEVPDTDHKYFDRETPPGSRLLVSPGKDGVKSETYINVYKDNVMVKRIKIRENTYKGVPRIIAVSV